MDELLGKPLEGKDLMNMRGLQKKKLWKLELKHKFILVQKKKIHI